VLLLVVHFFVLFRTFSYFSYFSYFRTCQTCPGLRRILEVIMMVPSPTFLNFKPPWIVHESTKVRKVQESTKSTVNEKKVHQTYKWSYNWQAQHPGHSPRTTSCVVLVSCLLLNVFGLCREPTSPNCNIVTGNREISSVCLACSAFAFPHSSARVDQRHDSSQSIRVYKYRSKVTH
jgi:hypothetical protein